MLAWIILIQLSEMHQYHFLTTEYQYILGRKWPISIRYWYFGNAIYSQKQPVIPI